MPSEGQPWDPALFGFLRGSLQMAQALRDAPGETLTRGVFRRAPQMAIYSLWRLTPDHARVHLIQFLRS